MCPKETESILAGENIAKIISKADWYNQNRDFHSMKCLSMAINLEIYMYLNVGTSQFQVLYFIEGSNF